MFLPLFSAVTSTPNSTEQMSMWQRMMPPEDISVHGHLIDALFNYTTALNVFFFALVCLGLFGFSWLYHHKRHKKPYYTYGTKKNHILVATIIGVSVFLFVDLNITRISNDDFLNVFINWPKEEETNVVKVQVMAQQWAWNFRYPGRDGVFNTKDDVVMLNDLRIPSSGMPDGKVDPVAYSKEERYKKRYKIVFQIISKDVIHSLFFPNARRKVDAIPGRMTRMWIDFTKPGSYDIACAEMCGTYHYRMQAKLTVYSPEDFAKWMAEAEERAIQENDELSPERYWGWKWQMAGN